MRRLTTGPVRICGAIGKFSAGPWSTARYLLEPPRLISGVPCAAGEIVLGQQLRVHPTAKPKLRTVLSGRIEASAGGSPAHDARAVAGLQQLLDQHGVSFLRRCRGEYCLAHLTRAGDTCYLYRGLTTSRGLFYRLWRNGLIFSTDPEDLCDPDRPLYRQIDANVLAAMALEAPVLDDASWYDGIRRLPAGHLLVVGPHGPRVHRHDDLLVAEPTRVPFPAAARTFGQLCSAAVDRVTAGTAAIGIELSGGLDSAVVAVEARRHDHGSLHAFHFHYDLPAMADELAMARAVADRCGVLLTSIDDTATLGPGGDYVLSSQPLRAPLTHGFVLPYLACCDALAAQPGPRRLLSGVGGDELQVPDFRTPLRGLGWTALNPLRAGAAPWQLFDNDVLRQLLGRPLGEPPPTGWSGLVGAARTLLGTAPLSTSALEPPTVTDTIPWFTRQAQAAARSVVRSAMQGYAEGFARAREGVKRTWHEMLATYLTFHRDINDYHMSGWQYAVFDDKGIEYVAPLLDRDLVEFALTLNTRYRQAVHRGHTVSKAPMRAAYVGRLPRALLGRLAKVDYSPIPETFTINNKRLLTELLGPDSRLAALGILSPGAVRRTLSQPTWQLRRLACELVQTASLELWLRGCERRPHQPIPVIERPATGRAPARPVAKPREPAPVAAGNGSWQLAPHALVRFLADEAVLLNEDQFKVYRLDAASAGLLSLILRCGTWPRLRTQLHGDDPAATATRLDNAQRFITSLINAGLLTGEPPATREATVPNPRHGAAG